jgi:hypothetical protein
MPRRRTQHRQLPATTGEVVALAMAAAVVEVDLYLDTLLID